MKKLAVIYICCAIGFGMTNCKKTEDIDAETTVPVIEKTFSFRDSIDFGGDTTMLVVIATGGNLNYLWDVDLGDILPMEDGHQAIFSGSECCVGQKNIKCTVSNDKGEVNATINVYIREPQ